MEPRLGKNDYLSSSHNQKPEPLTGSGPSPDCYRQLLAQFLKAWLRIPSAPCFSGVASLQELAGRLKEMSSQRRYIP